MKKLKKTVCVLLAILMLCGASAMAVHAQEEQTPDEDKLLRVFIDYLDNNEVEFEKEVVTAEFIMESRGWRVFFGYSGWGDPATTSERIGKYVFFGDTTYQPYMIALFAEKNGTILTLKEAYDAGEIDINQIADKEDKRITDYLAGDVDLDGVITLKDVLAVQKAIAKITELVRKFEMYNHVEKLCDYNGDGEITLEDVLAMQNAIAKIA